MKRTSTVIALALLMQGCWADFPEERFNQDAAGTDSLTADRGIQLEGGAEDVSIHEDGGTDGSVADAPQDGLAADTAAADGTLDAPTADTTTTDAAADSALADATLDSAMADTGADAALADASLADSALADTVPPPDTVPPDTVPPDTVPVDSYTCIPNAFLLCATATTLYRCNATGDNVVAEYCAPYLCNATEERCNECTPGDPPWCETNDLVACSANGLRQVTACGAAGCQNGVCCYNVDGDGSTTCGGDCDDNDADVFPGQTTFFDTARTSGGYDYNCDAVEEQEWTAVHSACVKGPSDCTGDGWETSVPACGVEGTWVDCYKSGNCQTTTTQRVQACR